MSGPEPDHCSFSQDLSARSCDQTYVTYNHVAGSVDIGTRSVPVSMPNIHIGYLYSSTRKCLEEMLRGQTPSSLMLRRQSQKGVRTVKKPHRLLLPSQVTLDSVTAAGSGACTDVVLPRFIAKSYAGGSG